VKWREVKSAIGIGCWPEFMLRVIGACLMRRFLSEWAKHARRGRVVVYHQVRLISAIWRIFLIMGVILLMHKNQ